MKIVQTPIEPSLIKRLNKNVCSTLVLLIVSSIILVGCNDSNSTKTGNSEDTEENSENNEESTSNNSENSDSTTEVNTKAPDSEEQATNNAPVFDLPTSEFSVVRGEFIEQAISATDTENDVLTFTATNLPSGLSIHQNTGVISGTASTTGNFTSQINISDNINLAVTTQVSWDVLANDEGLIAWYKFDESSGTTINDSSGYGNQGELIIQGDESFDRWTDGRIAGALTMDGGTDVTDSGIINSSIDDNDWVEIPMFEDLKEAASSMTVSAWAYRTVHQNVAILAHNYPYGLFFGFHEYTDQEVIDWSLQGNSVFKWGVVTDPTPTQPNLAPTDSAECWTPIIADANGDTAPLNQWFHMAGTWDGQTARLYVNGALICSKSPNNTMGGAAIDAAINDYDISISGFKNSGYTDSIKDEISGQIDDLRIYSRVLTSEQIGSLYNDGNSPE